MMEPLLRERTSNGGTVNEVLPGRWRMEIPSGAAHTYRWAQLDDYMQLARGKFLWHTPLQLSLRARVSSVDLPGTWGFGLWNDPFNASLGLGGMSARLPALPNAAWFFYAGEGNYLALRDDHPAQGFLAATFSAPRVPSLVTAPAGLALPVLALPPAVRLARRFASRLVNESGVRIATDPTGWHSYTLEWTAERVAFGLDGTEIFTTAVSPRGPLGLVIWIDNQFAAFPPSGKLRMGTVINPEPAWLEVEMVELTTRLSA